MKINHMLKKAACGIVALATIAATSISAFAWGSGAEGYDDSANLSSIPVTATYGLSAAPGLLPNGEFAYILSPVTVAANTNNADGDLVKSGVALVTNTSIVYKYTADAGKEVATEGQAIAEYDFASTPFKSATDKTLTKENISLPIAFVTTPSDGIYRYELSQKVIGVTNKDASYSTAVYTVDLHVQNGKIAIIQCYDKSGNKADPKFDNTINISSDNNLVIENYIYAPYSPKEDFTFTLKIPASGDTVGGVQLTKGEKIYAYTQDAEGNIKEVDLEVCGDDEDGFTYTLKSGEKLIVPGLPNGTMYWTTETNAGVDGYTSTYQPYANEKSEKVNFNSYSSSGDTDANPVQTAVTYNGQIGTNNYVHYRNVKEVTATGIAMEFAPYVVMFAAAAAIAVYAVSKKRKAER